MALHLDDWGVEEERAHPRGKGGKFIKKGTVETSAPELSPADQKKKEKLESKIEKLKEMQKSDPDTFEDFGYGDELKKLEKQLKKIVGGKTKSEPKKKKSTPTEKEKPVKPKSKESEKTESQEKEKNEKKGNTVVFDADLRKKLKDWGGVMFSEPIMVVKLNGETWRHMIGVDEKLCKCDEYGDAIRDEKGRPTYKPLSYFMGKEVETEVVFGESLKKKKKLEEQEKKRAEEAAEELERQKKKLEEHSEFEVEDGKTPISADMFKGFRAVRDELKEEVGGLDASEEFFGKLPSAISVGKDAHNNVLKFFEGLSQTELNNWYTRFSGIEFHKMRDTKWAGCYMPGTHDVYLKRVDDEFSVSTAFHETAHEAFAFFEAIPDVDEESTVKIMDILEYSVDEKELLDERDRLLDAMGFSKDEKLDGKSKKLSRIANFIASHLPHATYSQRASIEREVRDFLDIISFDDRCKIGGHTKEEPNYYSGFWTGSSKRYTEMFAIYSEHTVGAKAGRKESIGVLEALDKFLPKASQLAGAMYKLIFEE